MMRNGGMMLYPPLYHRFVRPQGSPHDRSALRAGVPRGVMDGRVALRVRPVAVAPPRALHHLADRLQRAPAAVAVQARVKVVPLPMRT